MRWPEARAAMVNLIGSLPERAARERLMAEGAHWHDYGKEPRPGRKVGHVTVVGEGAMIVERIRAIMDA